MPLPVSKIGEWSTTQLVKFIKDILENQTVLKLAAVIVKNLRVEGDLALAGNVSFPGNPDFHDFGGTGEPGFLNSWVNWGAPNFNAGYWEDPFGFVHLRGVVKNGTVGSPIAQLPPGKRPDATAGPFIVMSNGAAGRVDVDSDGLITPILPSNNTYVSLHGISFKAA